VQALRQVEAEVVECVACPRLVAWREQVATDKRAAFRSDEFWGRGVPGFGDPDASVMIVGLAPAAHGANRTGRMFTGDRSGDFLFAALHRAGFASQPTSVARGDGLALLDCYVAAVARCAPPANKPRPEEIGRCREYLVREWRILEPRAVLVLGRIALDGLVATLRAIERLPPRGAVAFGHGVEHDLGRGARLFCSFHVSQQNTFTGKLTAADMDAVLGRVRAHLGKSLQ
jgi:uracil-DNA glycosylase family 4